MTLTKVCSAAGKSAIVTGGNGPLVMLAGGELVGSNKKIVFVVLHCCI